ncbi:hypothetical protein SY83_04835 [Paenibacillus swuensis]|uniref:AraC family transcriptional regulator n=2 Tax=Paenibacillus swuensis TaxID=1178515 RepID=A0A172TP24_9BACL|nr:hypothetical protein SY83_04835 [Paenibacillus swuensis]
MIVDDESSTRLGLKEFFDWQTHQIEVIGLANDGESALPMILELHPDIVLTDVKMPFMDGITLAEEIKKFDKKIKIVFFSGFDDIDYLKSAMKLEAIDYLLKPIDFDELTQVLYKITSQVESERAQVELFQQMNVKLRQSFPLLREKFLYTLIRSGFPNAEAIAQQLAFLEMNLPLNASYCLLALHIDDYDTYYSGRSERDKQLSTFAVLNICQEIVDKTLGGYVFEAQTGQFVCLLHVRSEMEEETLFHVIETLKSTVLELLKLSLTIGVGSIVQGLRQVPHSYQLASDAANLKLYLGKNQIITMESLERTSLPDLWMDAAESEKLSSMLKAADPNKIRDWLRQLFDMISNNQTYDLPQCHRICLQIAIIGGQVASQLEIEGSGFSGERGNRLWEKLLQLETVSEMQIYLMTCLEELTEQIRQKRETKSSNVVEHVKSIIQDNMHMMISLNDLASRIYLTSTYICLLFKQETGETIHDYTSRVKMEKAKELLGDPRNKLYEVSSAIGYADSSYFTKLFKKYTGVTPSEYRESIR